MSGTQGERKWWRMVRLRVLVAAVVLALVVGVGCTGCVGCAQSSAESQQIVDWSDEVTERDIETARRLGAPDDIIQGLEGGEWPSLISKENVRVAEAAEDHLSERYGVEFQAFSVTLDRNILREPDSVSLLVASGPFTGETCICEFYIGGAPTDGKPNGGDPEWADNYIYVRLHGEYEEKVAAAAQSAFGDLPEGSWVCKVEMDDWTYKEVRKDASGSGEMITLDPNVSLAEAGPYITGDVWVYLSPDYAISDEECARRSNALNSALGGLGVNVSWGTYRVTKPLDGEEFTADWAFDACRDGEYDWSGDGYVTGVIQGSS